MSYRRSLAVILGVVALDATGMGMIMPVLPELLRKLVSETSVTMHFGLLLTIYALMQFICSPVLGALSDRFGRRPVVLVSLAGATVDYGMMAFATVLPIFYIGRLVSGITGATMAVASAAIIDITPEADRAKRFGTMGAFFGLGLIAGPLIGGFVGQYGVQYPFLAAMTLNFLAFTAALIFLPETNYSKGQPLTFKKLTPFGLMFNINSLRGLLPLLIVFTIIQLVGQLPASLWVIFTQNQFLWSVSTVGISLAIFGIGHAAVQGLLTGPITAWLGEQRTLVLGMVFDAIGYVLMAVSNHMWMIALTLLFLILGGIATPALQSIISSKVDDNRMGEVQGILASATSLTGITGPLIFTTIYAMTERQNGGFVWFVGAALYLFCIPALRTFIFVKAANRAKI